MVKKYLKNIVMVFKICFFNKQFLNNTKIFLCKKIADLV